ncbi:GBP domain containing protein, partial [Asbolus verrucosus]
MMEPHAEQIFNLDEDKKLTLDSETLRRILICDELKDKNVCVVSIAGAFRQGKSFLLNFLIRYLNIRYKEKRDVTKWLDSADGPLLGFSWATGSLRHTVGILMWSEVFLAQLPTGGEMAIILLDTQGSFDNSTTITECATIFALSTLISSIQIYNLKENIKQCDLSHLEFFTKYGQMILDNSEYSGPPFQNLLFLVRDWQWPHEREFGIKGGKQLLNHVLNTDDNDLNSEIMEQRKNIKNVFEKINCCLLPHPGTQVATDPKFQGELQDVDHKFLENIEMLIPHVLAPEQLIPKTVSGENIKIVDLVSIIESYWECFQNGEMPPLATLLEVTTLQHHMISKREAEKIYENSMKFLKDENDEFLNNEELITLHNQNKQRAIEFYSKKKKMGDPSISKRYEEELEM